MGRAGHSLHGVSKGILVALTRDELVECTALLRAVHDGELDAVRMPEAPLDVLAQQIVAACAVDAWDERALFALVKRAWPYRDLAWDAYAQVLQMLSEGVSERRGRMRVHLHRDRVNHVLRARKGARLTALMNGGAIPDTFTYPVVAEPEGRQVGTLDEDFAVETMAGDVFLLGSTSWRVQGLRGGVVRVEDARGRAAERAVLARRGAVAHRRAVARGGPAPGRGARAPRRAVEWLQRLGLGARDVEALAEYLRASRQVLGALPSARTVIAERFFDEAGGMQLILHAPFGGRINRAWGLALRKRFCRTLRLRAPGRRDGRRHPPLAGRAAQLPAGRHLRVPAPGHGGVGAGAGGAPGAAVRHALPLERHPGARAVAATRAAGACRRTSSARGRRTCSRRSFRPRWAVRTTTEAAEVEPPDHPLVHEALRRLPAPRRWTWTA